MKIRTITCALALSACTTLPPPATVIAKGETVAPAGPARPSGDPALWTGGRGPAVGVAQTGFVASTSPAEALVIHDLQGALVQHVPGAPLANTDVAALPLTDSYAILIGGTERSREGTRITLYRLDPGEGEVVRRWGEIATDLSEPRGFCMRQIAGVLRAAVIDRRGEVRQLEFSEDAEGQPVSRETRRYRVNDSGEGCAIDPINALVYFSHARAGFWRYGIAATGTAAPVHLIAPTTGRLPRSRGVAFLTRGREHLLASLDQDGATFSIWRVQNDELAWLGRVEVREHGGGRAVRNVAGLDAYGGGLGPYPEGVMVVQDQANDGAPNLKFVDWSAVWRALGL